MDTLREDIKNVPTTITACCVLHNLCIEFGDDTYIPGLPADDDEPTEGHVIDENGTLVREAIRAYLLVSIPNRSSIIVSRYVYVCKDTAYCKFLDKVFY